MSNRLPKRPRLARGPVHVRPVAPCLAFIFAFGLSGCPNQDLAPLEPCTVSGVSKDVSVGGVDKVDLLFVIDNSGSMQEEQEKLAKRLPDLVQILASGELPGGKTFPPVADLHLGVISTDMGASGAGIQERSCDDKAIYDGTSTSAAVIGQKEGEPRFGDDGILISRSRDPNCGFALNNTRHLEYAPGMAMGVTPQDVADQFKCLAALGTHGCGFEQQLEAMLKALSPGADTSFGQGTGGHGTGKNQGFLRDDAVLAVIHVSDEEDCSITSSGAELFIRTSNNENVFIPGTQDRIGRNLRCAWRKTPGDDESRAEEAGLIHPVSRYVDGLKKLKPNHPDRVIFGAIVGIPQELENAPPEEILNSSAMDFQVDPLFRDGVVTSENARALPACYGKMNAENKPDTEAMPGIRFVKTAQGFGTNGIVKSICADSYEGALTAIIEKISQQLTGSCLPRPLSPNQQGIVECDVVEILGPTDTEADCKPEKGRVFLEMRPHKDGGKRVVCSVNQAAVQNGQVVENPAPLAGVKGDVGWYYDDFTEEMKESCPDTQPHRIAFHPEGIEPKNSTIRFECFQPVARSDKNAFGKHAVNSACKEESECVARSDPEEAVRAGHGYRLTCAPGSKTCQIACQAHPMCPPSWTCNEGLCENPTCPPPTVN